MKVWFIFILLLFSVADVFGQSRADKLYQRGDYQGALKLYVQEYETNKNDDRLKVKIANTFFHLNDVGRSLQFYKMANENTLDADNMLKYAITLQRSGEYHKAKDLAELSADMGGDYYAAEQIKASADFAAGIAREKPLYSANKTGVDLSGFSAGVTYYKGNGVILAAPGESENAAKDTRGYKFTRLYNVLFSSDGKTGRMLPFGDELIDKYHIGAVTFTKDFTRIYYTKTILKDDGTSILKLMTAENISGKWENIEELSVNSDDYSCAHPSLYRDSVLFFVSDMPGGFGGKDIYMCQVEGSYCSDVENLGETINTPEEEMFPFMDDEGRLYFSSSGHVGLGGLDVFESQYSEGTWSTPKNMGRPINSSMDDFALVFKNTDNKEGFVSSNRGGTGVYDFVFALRAIPGRAPEVKPEKPVVEVPEKDLLTVDYNYAIQIGAFRNPVPRVYFDNFEGVKVYKGIDNIYRYAIGEYPEERIAASELGLVRRTINDAFIVDVNRYIAEGKIQNGKEGDKVDDNELLLRRLRNFELEKQQGRGKSSGKSKKQEGPRYLDKPWTKGEVAFSRDGYTVVLMSANRVMDINRFSGIGVVDVYRIEDGTYNYCTETYTTIAEANRYLREAQNMGFNEAYVARIDIGSHRHEQDRTARNTGLKDVLKEAF